MIAKSAALVSDPPPPPPPFPGRGQRGARPARHPYPPRGAVSFLPPPGGGGEVGGESTS